MPCEKKQVAAVILDWAGTSVDFGCFAPLCVLLDIFAEEGLNIQTADAREPMGLAKKEHIRKILEMEHVAKELKRIMAEISTRMMFCGCITNLHRLWLTLLRTTLRRLRAWLIPFCS